MKAAALHAMNMRTSSRRFDPCLLVASMRAQDALTRLASILRQEGEAIQLAWQEVSIARLRRLYGVGRKTIREIVDVAIFEMPDEGGRLLTEWYAIYANRGPRCPHCGERI